MSIDIDNSQKKKLINWNKANQRYKILDKETAPKIFNAENDEDEGNELENVANKKFSNKAQNNKKQKFDKN